MIKLEVGRRYVNRQGKVWAPVIASSDPDDFYKFEMVYEGWTYHFSEAGRLFEAEESPCDLIALAPDEAPQPQQPDELATLRERVRELEAEGDRLRDCYKTEVLKAQEYLRMNDTLRAENARLREALDSIEVYGSDTLSGRVTPDAATYKDWLIDGIRVMRDRARAALAKARGQ